MDTNQVVGDVVAGCVVATFVGLFAWVVTGRLARNYEARKARRDRDLAAAEELYEVYGQFFATWKAWEYMRGRKPRSRGSVGAEARADLLAQAARCEGLYESLL